MNQEEILRALEICTDGDGSECETCPLAVVPGCMNKLIREARDYILSLLEKPAVDARQESEPWTRKRVLSEAERCVCGQREQDYGTPDDSFQKIAALWTAYLSQNSIVDTVFSAYDVAVMMALLKIARISENPGHMDSWVDGCGYFACGGEIAGKDAEQGGSHEN